MKKILLIVLLSISSAFGGKPEPQLRRDLAGMQEVVCLPAKGLQRIWRLGVYDTLLSGKVLQTIQYTEQTARDYARSTGNQGFVFGKCRQGNSWILTVSAPYPASVRGRTVTLSPQLKNYCRGLQAMYARSNLSFPVSIAIKNNRLLLPTSGPGLVAVRCKSLTPQQTGPRLLYAFPRGNPAVLPPFLAAKIKENKVAVQRWLTVLRQKLRLPPLRFDRVLQERDSSPRFSVIHDRSQLLAVKDALRKQRLAFIGENRARAHTLTEALTMLWMSPFHRSLLLHREGMYLDLNVSRQKDQILVTMILAR